jgi:hypothetical protein
VARIGSSATVSTAGLAQQLQADQKQVHADQQALAAAAAAPAAPQPATATPAYGPAGTYSAFGAGSSTIDFLA